MKKSTKNIFAAAIAVSVVSCGGYMMYGPGPDVDVTDDYTESIAAEQMRVPGSIPQAYDISKEEK